jgi:hypothetical protein
VLAIALSVFAPTGWLFRDAALRFKLFEKLTRRPNFPLFPVFQALMDAILRIDASGNALQILMAITQYYVRGLRQDFDPPDTWTNSTQLGSGLCGGFAPRSLPTLVA